MLVETIFLSNFRLYNELLNRWICRILMHYCRILYICRISNISYLGYFFPYDWQNTFQYLGKEDSPNTILKFTKVSLYATILS